MLVIVLSIIVGLLGLAGLLLELTAWSKRRGASAPTGGFSGPRDGVIDGVAFEVRTEQRRWRAPRTTVTCRASGTADLVIGRDRGASAGTDRDVRLGDAYFDENVGLQGARAAVLAVFDAPVRDRVLWAVRVGWRFADGAWTLGPEPMSDSAVEAAIGRGVELTKGLRLDPTELPARLLESVSTDPLAVVRAGALEELARGHGAHAATATALARASEDREPRIRVMAASLSDDLPRLLHWARAESGTLGATALATLVADHAADPRAKGLLVEEALLRLLAHAPDRLTQAAAMRALGAIGSLDAVPTLAAYGHLVAREAIEAIQARHPEAARGGLMIAPSDARGGVALTEPAPAEPRGDHSADA